MSDNMPDGKKKILVVDDEPNVVTYLEALLQDNGYDTITASNGHEGMEKVKAEKPHLICLDITMPKASGIQFYRNLKEDPALQAIPVVIVTAVTGYGGDPDGLKKFLNARRHVPPPEAFFHKPIDKSEFTAKIKQLLS
jgi:two-component system, cell cycle response regulator DivK